MLHNNALLIIIIAPSHDSSIKGPSVIYSDAFSSGTLKLFTFHGERAFGSWLWSQTAAIKSSGSGNVFLKLRAHILVVRHMQFLCKAPTSAACLPLLVEEYVRNELKSVFLSKGLVKLSVYMHNNTYKCLH